MSFFKEFGKWRRVFDSETYKETIKSAERITQYAYRVLADKSPEEAAAIGDRVAELSLKMQETVGEEKPFIAALALLTTMRVLDLHVQKQVENLKGTRK
jgi:hypothetical protein